MLEPFPNWQLRKLGSEMKPTLISSLCLMLLMAFSKATQNECKPFKCGDHGPAIHFPFHLKGSHPDRCGYPGFVVSCNERKETILELPNTPLKFSVETIDYSSQKILLHVPDKCLGQKLINFQNISFSPFQTQLDNFPLFNCSFETVTYINRTELEQYFVPCLSLHSGDHIYAFPSDYRISSDVYTISDLPTCTKISNVLSPAVSFFDNQVSVLSWRKPDCSGCESEGNECRLKNDSTKTEVECIKHRRKPTKAACCSKSAVAIILLLSVLLLLLIPGVYHAYTYDKNKKENLLKIERFLEDYKALQPSRYSFADIKLITNQFKDKLGEGAYGTVYKGNISSEFFVAVKVLNNSKGNGEEFINEVGTMGHIHHVNVARLVGFCADGFRRALVYDFFPNGSLHDFISSEGNQNDFLSWEKLHDIALGIANGIEYLHQGCDQRILHFDIKPHNVLLDQNFTPKLSDFGLAKLCSKDQSIVSMTTARGTMGYIAPEVFSRNFGNVSYKSDVYSFGMLLLEMVGRRGNVGAATENTNDVYYPEWIYNLLESGEGPRIHIVEEGDSEILTKLAIIGLWCIQWNPVDRPSMKAVVQMLEVGENLTMPPNPFGSTGDSTRINTSVPIRNLNLQLETIVELE